MPPRSVGPATLPSDAGSPQTTTAGAVHGPEQQKQTHPFDEQQRADAECNNAELRRAGGKLAPHSAKAETLHDRTTSKSFAGPEFDSGLIIVGKIRFHRTKKRK